MPFVAISRAVAEATLLEQSQRLMRTARIYDAIRRTTTGYVERSRIADALTRELRCPVFVCDRFTGAAYHPEGPHRRKPSLRRCAPHPGAHWPPAPARSSPRTAPRCSWERCRPTTGRRWPSSGGAMSHSMACCCSTLPPSSRSSCHIRTWPWNTAAGRAPNSPASSSTAAPISEAREGNCCRAGLDPAHAVFVCASCSDEPRLRDLDVALWRRRIPHVLVVRSGVAHAVAPRTGARWGHCRCPGADGQARC